MLCGYNETRSCATSRSAIVNDTAEAGNARKKTFKNITSGTEMAGQIRQFSWRREDTLFRGASGDLGPGSIPEIWTISQPTREIKPKLRPRQKTDADTNGDGGQQNFFCLGGSSCHSSVSFGKAFETSVTFVWKATLRCDGSLQPCSAAPRCTGRVSQHLFNDRCSSFSSSLAHPPVVIVRTSHPIRSQGFSPT